jgi:DNA-binding transcriptional MerR regulator
MKSYTVQQLATLAGVSVRTLHLYDELGLLKPARRTESRYRVYGDNELLRLQQILLYKELDVPLQQIGRMLDDPEFDILEALKRHKEALRERRGRLDTLLNTIETTITHLEQGEALMTPEQLYEGLPKETAEAYHREASERWGSAVKRSEAALKNMGKTEFEELKHTMKITWNTLFTLRNEDPTSDDVQRHIEQHYIITRKFWGTAHWQDNQAEAFKGLGQMFVDDPRFTMMDGKPQPEFAAFLCEAITYFAETRLEVFNGV